MNYSTTLTPPLWSDPSRSPYSRYIYTKAEIDKMIKERARAKGLDNEDWKFPYGGDRDKRQEKVNLIIENVEPKLQECLDRAKGK